MAGGMLLTMVGLVISFLSGSESAPCASYTVVVDVTSTAGVHNLTEALACTGGGAFDITWYSNLTITQRIEVSNKKNVTVTGNGFPTIRGALLDDNEAIAIVPAGSGTGTGTGIFSVSNGSILRLNGLALQGGDAENGGAVDVLSSSSLFVFDCTFSGNNATNGGAISSFESTIYVSGNNSFGDNSAVNGGAIFLDGNSSMQVDGNTSFFFNHALGNGGGIYMYDNSFMRIDGSTSFIGNAAESNGGVLYASTNCSINVAGNSSFDKNFAWLSGGGAFLHNYTFMDISGSISFLNNIAQDDGGAIFLSSFSAVKINGSSSFHNNFAEDGGGAIYGGGGASVVFNGNVSFTDNVANKHGGALQARESSYLELTGNSVFDNNSANTDGGAIYLREGSFLQVDGSIALTNNIAGDDGGAIGSPSNGSININGNISFVDNNAKETGGALYASQSTAVQLVGNSVFDNNLAGIDGGAMFMFGGSSLHTMGSTAFLNNNAEDDGGAISAEELCSINFAGDTTIFNNSARDNGGGLFVARDSSAHMVGNTLFHNNSARNSGGAIYASQSEIRADGVTSVTFNAANSPGGGAVYSSKSDVNFDGSTYIAHNSGFDGGAILAQDSKIHVTGNATFAYNAANRDGGAIMTTESSVAISTTAQDMEISSTESNLAQDFKEGIHFIGNTAFDYGGAMSIANADKMNVSDVVFTLNKAEFGGAVGLTSTRWAAAKFQRCRFESNKGTSGGALHIDGKGQRTLHDSSFRLNVAEEAGGAISNTGALDIKNTVFAENMATDGGLAIHSTDSDVVLWNVTFDGNIRGCPTQTYSFTQDTSPGSCRFELACSQCLPGGCESDLSNVAIDRDTLPTCEPIPVGVRASLSATTLQTFDIEEGYFRISAESPIVLECFQKDACVGGIDPSHYCADGYSGPYCAVCKEDYVSGASRRCHECSGENRRFAVGFAATVLLLVLLAAVLVVSYLLQVVGDVAHQAQRQPRRWWHAKVSSLRNFLVKAMPLSSIRIVVVVSQIVIQFTEIAGTVYPDEYESFLSAMALVNFDVGSILASSCLVSTDFYGRLVLTTVAPIVILLVCVVTFVFAKRRNGNSNTAGHTVRHRHVSLVLFMVFFVYSSVSFTIFQTFVCDSLDDGKAYLRADYSITCLTERYKAYRLYACVMAFIYPVGIPAFFAFWLVRHRRELGKPGRDAVSHLKSYRALWGAYKPSRYYYEVVECGRRIVLTGAAVFVMPNTAEQVAIVLFFAVVFMFVSESLSPFQSKSDTWLYRWGNGVILASMYVAFLLKVDFAQEGSETTFAITALLIAAHVFMIVTVAVQAFLLMREMCTTNVRESATPPRHWRTHTDSFSVELEAPDDHVEARSMKLPLTNLAVQR